MSALTGPVLAEYQDLFSSSTTAGGPNGGLQLGAKAYTGDGREFRFSFAGASNLVPGKLYQNPAETTAWENVAVAAAAIGATKVTVTASLTVALNALAGGYLNIAVTPGQGYMYQIAANTAVSAAANMVITLVDPIQVALTTSSTVSLQVNPYNGVILYPTTGTSGPAGVPVYPVTASQYGWLQVVGAANLLNQGGTTVSNNVVPSTSVAGAVKTVASTLPTIGYAMQTLTDTQYGPVWLTIG